MPCASRVLGIDNEMIQQPPRPGIALMTLTKDDIMAFELGALTSAGLCICMSGWKWVEEGGWMKMLGSEDATVGAKIDLGIGSHNHHTVSPYKHYRRCRCTA